MGSRPKLKFAAAQPDGEKQATHLKGVALAAAICLPGLAAALLFLFTPEHKALNFWGYKVDQAEVVQSEMVAMACVTPHLEVSRRFYSRRMPSVTLRLIGLYRRIRLLPMSY